MEASTALTPRLEQAGIAVVERDGARMIEIPDELRAKCNVLVPVSEIVQANPLWQPAIRAVRLDKDRHSYPGQKRDELALNKHAVLLLARTAGIDVVRSERMPIAVLREHEIGWQATVRVRRADGTHEEMTESRVMDLEVERLAIDYQVDTGKYSSGKPEHERAAEKLKRWHTERPHFDAKCETKALLRAVRAVLQLPHAFSERDFAKPFLVLTYAFSPDTNDPEVMRALISAGVNGSARMYGTPRAIEAGDESMDVTSYGPIDGEIPMGTPPRAIAAAAEPVAAPAVSEKAPEEPETRAPQGEPVTGANTTPPASEAAAPTDAGALVITFGKYKGQTLAQILNEDSSYVEWLADKGKEPAVRTAAADLLGRAA